jgi:hypothetical protein
LFTREKHVSGAFANLSAQLAGSRVFPKMQAHLQRATASSPVAKSDALKRSWNEAPCAFLSRASREYNQEGEARPGRDGQSEKNTRSDDKKALEVIQLRAQAMLATVAVALLRKSSV